MIKSMSHTARIKYSNRIYIDTASSAGVPSDINMKLNSDNRLHLANIISRSCDVEKEVNAIEFFGHIICSNQRNAQGYIFGFLYFCFLGASLAYS